VSTNDLPQDCRVLNTRIPEGHTVEGLKYGRHVSTPGWSGYYVRPADSDLPMMVARLDPEHVGNDAETLDAIAAEMDGLLTTAERIAGAASCAADAMSMADGAVADQDWYHGRTVYRFDDGSMLAVEGPTFGPITTAQRVAMAFGNDGQRFTHAVSGHSLEEACLDEGADVEYQEREGNGAVIAGTPTRYVFTDGSAIVLKGEG